jgi:hypothetical protein
MFCVPFASFALDCPFTAQQSFEYLHNKYGNAVTAVDGTYAEFSNQGFGDADLQYICSLQSLDTLKIYNDGADNDHPDKLTGATLDYIALLKNLKYLDLDGNKITATQLGKLSGLQSLESLKLGMGNPIGDAGMEQLDKLPNLKFLILQADDLGPEDLHWLERSNKVYEQIAFIDNPRLDNAALVLLANAKSRNLRRIRICNPFRTRG